MKNFLHLLTTYLTRFLLQASSSVLRTLDRPSTESTPRLASISSALDLPSDNKSIFSLVFFFDKHSLDA